MKFNFKKISAIGSSLLLAGMSIAAPIAAANYPNPFVVGGAANVAVVYGTGEGVSSLDIIQAGNIQSNLQSYMGGGSTSTEATVTGEAAPLFSGGTRLYINDSLNTVKTVLTSSNLPIVLKDQSFSGNVDASMTQKLDIGSDPKITFAKQPTSSDDPSYGLTTSTTQTKYIYNATATFNKAVNFSHADSEGESITLFGMDFTVGAATDTDTLVLLKSAEKLDLDSDNPSAEVTIEGKSYTVELVSASDTAATIRVIDSSGSSESKEITEAQSKKVNGVTVAVTTADETNLKLSASIVAGSNKLTFEDGSSVTQGEDDSVIDGTLVDFGAGNPNNLTTFTISVYAPESDKDAIKEGESYIDPVYGTFKVDFSGFNIAQDTTSTARETISIDTNGDDKMDVKFTDHRGYEKTITWAKNTTTIGLRLMHDDDKRNITVVEMKNITYQEYVVVGNEDEGYLLKLSSIKNQTSGYSNDYCKFTDVFSGDTYETTWVSDGVGSISIGGKSYNVYTDGASDSATESYQVHLDYPDSSGNGVVILYPTIQTSKGAKIAFYEPQTLDLDNYGRRATGAIEGYNITEIKTPDGDGYESVTAISHFRNVADVNGTWNFTVDGAVQTIGTNAANRSGVSEGLLWNVEGVQFNITNTNSTSVAKIGNQTTIYLVEADGDGNINKPALIVWEEKDDNNAYQALIVELEEGATGDDGLGIDSVEDTWSNAASGWKASKASDSKKEDRGDLWGSLITVDSSDSDQKSATISYPDEQLYGQIYISEEAATIIAGGASVSGSTQLGDVLVKDSEVSSVSSKNLVIIGGSCINSAAAKVLGVSGKTCGAAFTESTGVGSGEFLIKSVSGAYTEGKIALVVAGYEVADTVNAATYLRTQVVDTSKEYKGTSSTTATLVTTETA